MSTAFGALLIGVVGAVLVVALIAFLWVNRTPSTNERFDEHGRVPLFGVDLSGARPVQATAPARTAHRSGAIRDDLAEVEEMDSAETVSGTHVAATPLVEQHGAGRPMGKPIAIDSSALEAVNSTVAPPPAAQPMPMPAPAPGNRPRGGGWGLNRGWPAGDEQPVTPRFVPPVRDGQRPTSPSAPVRETPPNGNGVYADGVPGSMVEGHRIRFSTPMEGTLQFLPGRLEISSGLDTGREIRFVKLPGPNGTEVTFGRNEGPLYRHIQLRDQTVSREHARMTLVDGRWLLTNLSNTNPVAHNGRVLSPGEHQSLDDGDRLEMGEVVFSFRSR